MSEFVKEYDRLKAIAEKPSDDPNMSDVELFGKWANYIKIRTTRTNANEFLKEFVNMESPIAIIDGCVFVNMEDHGTVMFTSASTTYDFAALALISAPDKIKLMERTISKTMQRDLDLFHAAIDNTLNGIYDFSAMFEHSRMLAIHARLEVESYHDGTRSWHSSDATGD